MRGTWCKPVHLAEVIVRRLLDAKDHTNHHCRKVDIMNEYTAKKCLVAYFSHRGMNYVSGKIVDLQRGNTERAAEIIVQLTGGTAFRIETEAEYPYEYRETVAAAKEEKKTQARPALRHNDLDVADYDLLFLGYPNWCGTIPMAVAAFLESHDFSGMTIKPFCTHEGSGFGTSLQDILALCPSCRLEEGLALFGTTVGDAESDIRHWLYRE